MVCCAAYWERHSLDQAGKVGVSLQKILFFLSALTMATFLTFNPATLLCSSLALLVYAVGIHGAQKRNHRALFFYGAVSLCSVITTLVIFGFFTGFMLFGGMHVHRHVHPLDSHWSQSSMSAMKEHALQSTYSTMTHHGMMEYAGIIYERHENADQWNLNKASVGDNFMPADMVDNYNGDAYDLNSAGEVYGDDEDLSSSSSSSSSSSRRHNRRQHIDEAHDLVYNDVSSSDQYEDIIAVGPGRKSHESNDVAKHHLYHVTTFGYIVLAGLFVFSLLIFSLKVRSIKLAFRMRRMLLVLQRQRLPTSMRATPVTAPVPPVVTKPSTPAPARRRDCERCTYLNVAGAARCAMCDATLPFVAAPSGVHAPPRVYVPGSLYPLNQPLN